MSFEYLIDKDYNFSRFGCFFLLVQVILGNVNSHSGFPTPCREAYNDIFPLQGRLGNFHLVGPKMQFWLRGCSFCHILFIWRKLKGRKIRERAIKQLRLGSLKPNVGFMGFEFLFMCGPNQSIFLFFHVKWVSALRWLLQDTTRHSIMEVAWGWRSRGRELTGRRT